MFNVWFRVMLLVILTGISFPVFANGQYSHNERHPQNSAPLLSRARLRLKHIQQQFNYVLHLQKELKIEQQKLDVIPSQQNLKFQEKLKEVYRKLRATQSKLARLQIQLRLQYTIQFMQVQLITIRSVAKSTAHISVKIHRTP